jgi:hypothetical protein
MVLPLLALGLGTLASVGGSMYARNEADNNAAAVMRARNAALMDSLARQRKFQEENQLALDSAFDRFAQPVQEEQQQKAVEDRTAGVLGNAVAPSPDASDIPLNGNAPKVIRSAIAKRMSDAFAKTTDRARATAKLGAYGDMWGKNDIAVNNTGHKVGMFNNFSRGEAALLPADQELAGYVAHKPSSGIGESIAALGTLAAGAGGAGMFGSLGGAGSLLTGAGSAVPAGFGAVLKGAGKWGA